MWKWRQFENFHLRDSGKIMRSVGERRGLFEVEKEIEIGNGGGKEMINSGSGKIVSPEGMELRK